MPKKAETSPTSFELAFKRSGLGDNPEEITKKISKEKIRESGEYKNLLDIYNSIKAGKTLEGYPDTAEGFLKE